MENRKIRVGILSLNMYTTDLNYACRIHSYAFQQFLECHGIECQILDYFPCHCNPEFDMRHPFDYYKSHPCKDETKQRKDEEKWGKLFLEREERFDKTERFINNHFRKTDIQYTTRMLDIFDPGFDIYIAATDVLWKYRDNTGFDKGFFLQSNCMKGKGKIAYAVSYGGKRYSREKLDEIKGLVDDIDFISTREKYLYDTLRDETDKSISIVLDPVFLQDVEFYNHITQTPREDRYVLVYNVIKNSRTVVDTATRYAERKGLKVIELSSYKENENYPAGTHHEVIYGAGVEEWLGYIKNAECIFTNSFHGCCFSIIFNKKFYVGERGGTKIPWLLEIFELKNRWIEPAIDLDKLEGEIDYDRVDQLMEQYRDKSAAWILNAIEILENKLKVRLFEGNSGIEQLLWHDNISECKRIRISYNSKPGASVRWTEPKYKNCFNETLKITQKGSYEYSEEEISYDNSKYKVRKCFFEKENYHFVGWTARARISKDDNWKFLSIDGNWYEGKIIQEYKRMIRFFTAGEEIDLSCFRNYKSVIFVAEWEKAVDGE